MSNAWVSVRRTLSGDATCRAFGAVHADAFASARASGPRRLPRGGRERAALIAHRRCVGEGWDRNGAADRCVIEECSGQPR